MTEPHTVKLSLKEKNAAETVSIEAEIPADEWAVLESFYQYSGELLSTKFVQEGMPSSLRIQGSSDGPITFETQLPNWDDVVVFLHYLRPLFLQSERANFYAACTIIARRLANPQIQTMVRVWRDLYSGKLLRSAIRISVNDKIVNSEEVLSAWLNSYEYHRDPDRRQFLETIKTMLPFSAAQVLFIQQLAEKVKAISSLSSFVAVILGLQRSITTTPPSL
jgi:hypothetical protein